MKISMKFEPRDLWIGVYWNKFRVWNTGNSLVYHTLMIYLCIIPMLPIILEIKWRRIHD